MPEASTSPADPYPISCSVFSIAEMFSSSVATRWSVLWLGRPLASAAAARSFFCSSRSNYFFANAMQGMMYGGSRAGDKPAGYRAPVLVEGSGSGVE